MELSIDSTLLKKRISEFEDKSIEVAQVHCKQKKGKQINKQTKTKQNPHTIQEL